MYDIYGVNSTKLSVDEGLHVIPGFRLASGISEAMLELQEMDLALFKEMLKSDYQELKLKQSGYVNEAQIEAIHEGVFTKMHDAISKAVQWFINTMKSLWHTIVGFISKIVAKIKFFFSALKNYEPTKEDLKFKVTWTSKSYTDDLYKELMSLKSVREIGLEHFTNDFGENFAKTFASNWLDAKDNETNEVEIGKVNELSSPKAVLDTILDLEDKSRRGKSRADVLIKGVKWLEDNLENYDHSTTVRVKPTKDGMKISASISAYMKQTTYYCKRFTDHITEKLKVCNSVMAHYMACQKKSKESIKKESVNSILFDPEFIREMSDYDFDEMYESCYIDNTGAVVCNG